MAKLESRSRRSSQGRRWVRKYEPKGNNVEEIIKTRDLYYEAIGFECNLERREENDVLFRVAFACAMDAYYTKTSIAKALKKDHSSICHYVNKLVDIYRYHYDSFDMLVETVSCIYHMEVGSTSVGKRLRKNIKDYYERDKS